MEPKKIIKFCTIPAQAAVRDTRPLLVGAAVKVALAGGPDIDTSDAFRASGLSRGSWQAHGEKVMRLAQIFEAE